LNVWIGAEFDWKATDESLNRIVEIGSHDGHKGHPQLLGQFNIELTLTKRRTGFFRSGQLQYAKINEACLTEDAFRPKVYTIRLEKGNFITPNDARARMEDNLTERFALRLVFDKSPYPSRCEWKKPELGPDAIQFWEWKEFAARKCPELKRHVNSRSLWDTCIII
jgi:hypothetical protein